MYSERKQMDIALDRQAQKRFINVRHMFQRLDEYILGFFVLVFTVLGLQPVTLTVIVFVFAIRVFIGQKNMQKLDDYLGIPRVNFY